MFDNKKRAETRNKGYDPNNQFIISDFVVFDSRTELEGIKNKRKIKR